MKRVDVLKLAVRAATLFIEIMESIIRWLDVEKSTPEASDGS